MMLLIRLGFSIALIAFTLISLSFVWIPVYSYSFSSYSNVIQETPKAIAKVIPVPANMPKVSLEINVYTSSSECTIMLVPIGKVAKLYTSMDLERYSLTEIIGANASKLANLARKYSICIDTGGMHCSIKAPEKHGSLLLIAYCPKETRWINCSVTYLAPLVPRANYVALSIAEAVGGALIAIGVVLARRIAEASST